MNVHDAIKIRRTVRSFKQEHISRESIAKMIDCARLSPSAGNIQPIKYAIIDSEQERKSIFPYVKYAGYIPDWSPDFSESPVAFIAVLKDKSLSKSDLLTQCDCGAAMMAILLSGVEMGIDGCILGAINREKISEIINLNPAYEILYLIGIGKSGQNNLQFDSDSSVKYSMNMSHNFSVPKRKLKSIIVNR